MEIITFKSSTHSSHEAAQTLGCEVSQIIKTLIFHDRDNYFITILRGDSRINYQRLKEILNIKRPSLASPEKVIEISGSTIGGVKPIFRTDLEVILDIKVLENSVVYGGGGDSNSVSKTTPEEIIKEMKPIIEDISL